jgi:hypothetical protein
VGPPWCAKLKSKRRNHLQRRSPNTPEAKLNNPRAPEVLPEYAPRDPRKTRSTPTARARARKNDATSDGAPAQNKVPVVHEARVADLVPSQRILSHPRDETETISPHRHPLTWDQPTTCHREMRRNRPNNASREKRKNLVRRNRRPRAPISRACGARLVCHCWLVQQCTLAEPSEPRSELTCTTY